MNYKISLVVVWLMIVRCQNSSHSGPSTTHQQKRKIVYYEDPLTKNSRQELFVKHLARLMGMPDMRSNDADLYLRIWFWDFDDKYVVNISKKGKNYADQIIEWGNEKKDSVEYIVIQREWKNIVPVSSWENLWTRVRELQNIRDGKKRDELKSQLTQMSYVQFEIGGQGKYRYFEYLEPSFYRYIDSPSNEIYKFLKMLNEELNVKVYNPADSLYVEKDKE
jgi:hypothetical protein